VTQQATSTNAKGTPGDRPASQILSSFPLRAGIAFVILLALAVSGFVLHAHGHAALSLSLVFGAIFGILLQRARFCFFCITRDWLDDRNPSGLLGLATALAVGIAGYTIVFGAWLPDATTGRLPPRIDVRLCARLSHLEPDVSLGDRQRSGRLAARMARLRGRAAREPGSPRRAFTLAQPRRTPPGTRRRGWRPLGKNLC
jgi:hypothetical protein